MSATGELQRRFQRAVLSEDFAPGLFVAEGREIAGGLGLYLMAYRARLLSALRDNFPVLHRALGDEAFAELARDYIDAHPSRFRSIRWFGDELTAFLDAGPERLPHPALADVARIEGDNLPAIKTRLHRAKQRLRDLLQARQLGLQLGQNVIVEPLLACQRAVLGRQRLVLKGFQLGR